MLQLLSLHFSYFCQGGPSLTAKVKNPLTCLYCFFISSSDASGPSINTSQGFTQTWVVSLSICFSFVMSCSFLIVDIEVRKSLTFLRASFFCSAMLFGFSFLSVLGFSLVSYFSVPFFSSVFSYLSLVGSSLLIP